jgi:hypothetical protein
MKIRTTQTFLDGTTRYEGGQEYEVLDTEGYYFCKMGWAVDAAAVTLDIQDVKAILNVPNVGVSNG